MSIQSISQVLPAFEPRTKSGGGTDSGDKSFAKLLGEAIGQVNDLQNRADKAAVDLVAGKIEDISQVVIATEKAAIALQLTMQVRNKIVDAYQEVMRMQV